MKSVLLMFMIGTTCCSTYGDGSVHSGKKIHDIFLLKDLRYLKSLSNTSPILIFGIMVASISKTKRVLRFVDICKTFQKI